jgi:peptidoglycan-associated lipoprotein
MLKKMKKLLIIVTFLLTTSIIVKAQTFDLNSTKYKVGDKFVPRPGILFDLAKWNIRTESYPLLDSIVEFLFVNKKIILEIGYHTDYKRSSYSSVLLDLKRAQSITDYLISKGINRDRLIPKGYDSTQPIVVDSLTNLKYNFLPKGKILNEEFIRSLSNVEEQYAANNLNRRTEFKIISTKYKLKKKIARKHNKR